MRDERADIEEAAAEVDPADVEPDPEHEQDFLLAPTRSTRTRPSALDLERAFD